MKKLRKVKVKIKHVDGVTDVNGTAFIGYGENITVDYKHEGVCYTITLNDSQAEKLKLK